MIYFKKYLLKKITLSVYIYFNSLNILINKIFRFFNLKKKIQVYYGGSLKGNLGGTLVKIERLNEYFKNHNFRFNIVYLLSNSIYLNKISLRSLKKSKIPIIHNQNGVFYKGWYGSGWERKNNEMSFQYQIADYVFYQSKFSQSSAEKFLGIRNGPGEVLFNAVDQKKFFLIEKRKINSELRILVSGKYQEHLYYSLEYVIKILKQLIVNNISAKINFAGYYEPVVIKRLSTLATGLGIKDNIEFSGIYNQENANSIYNSADIYFYFVHQSNCPNSVIEAMSTGMPTLTSNTGGMPEIVTPDSGICLDCIKSWEIPQLPSINDAVNGVKKIIKNYDDYSDNSIKKVIKDHNIINWISKHEEIFKKFI
jgi:glycosyltransferase involved in cell wall biosynthesis